ncbi:hypothetical protein COCC4DRAFT_146455 [Bipolaris maydis ATCC 48331]|uniref:Uncharacterized protein n=2 Tax=Cochliobolus heterostrophus TaxID=5016 RepID=M2THT5_COCH5|nr:uncharacterized protein COCC4DRAFT_146455 [Bipolaris maydis ATCC 48331]EMD86069.1 hypothetical protein COCHEDRAFT_1161000 [Bipolaris maydis C5]KAJ5028160.1 hypothetical protein J3E73DRAFT_256069 [Bipolaris maydis]ENI02072.1 hypothetical protein COCC4DRAFT_146455 [Bipolaris maydis ATCC 48331]KAJ5035664.1 hypothetical protein J3E74DRAFT_413541 [Bipolaris maydis]KAJ5062936.1 hypothetical protein J3E74DRAFT_404561 [Bipolaris maydis]
MAMLKSLLLAATALINVAVASTAFSSGAAPAVTSIHLVTSVTFISGVPDAHSKTCDTTTVTQVAPPTTVTVTAIPSTTAHSSAATSGLDKTVQVSFIPVKSTTVSTATLHETKTATSTTKPPYNVPVNSTVPVAAPTLTFSHSHHANSSTVFPTGTGASPSASYSPPYTSPEFNAATGAKNMAGTVLVGSVVLALLGA